MVRAGQSLIQAKKALEAMTYRDIIEMGERLRLSAGLGLMRLENGSSIAEMLLIKRKRMRSRHMNETRKAAERCRSAAEK